MTALVSAVFYVGAHTPAIDRRTARMTPLTTVLAIYVDHPAAQQALAAIRRRGHRHAVLIEPGPAARRLRWDWLRPSWVASSDVETISPAQSALLGATVALVVLAGYGALLHTVGSALPAIGSAIVLTLAGALAGALVGGLTARLLGAGARERLLARFRHWVVPGETLLVVQARAGQARELISVLRGEQAVALPVFVLRPAQTGMAEPAPAGDEPPLPGARLPVDRLREHAAAMARVQSAALSSRRQRRPQPLLSRLKHDERTITAVCAGLAEVTAVEQGVSPAGEWLLDNAYLVRRHIDDVRRNLSRGLYGSLPVLVAGSHAGLPRIYRLAVELAALTDAGVETPDLTAFLRAYQEVEPLTIAELWAMPLMLRLALIGVVRDLAIRIDRRQREHELADFLANRLLTAARRDPDALLFALATLAREHAQPAPYFAERLVSQLQGEAGALDALHAWLERKLEAPITEVIQDEQRRHAADQVTIANAIGSLRRLSELDWRDIFEQVSLVDRELAADPAGVYRQMDFATRDRYRQAIEEIARGAGLAEIDAARAAIALAAECGFETERPGSSAVDATSEGDAARARRHVGYYLVDEGRWLLEARAGFRPALGTRLRRALARRPALVYVGSITCLTSVLAAATAALVVRAGVVPALAAGLVLVALLPASEIAVQVVNWVVTHIMPPRVLPKMWFPNGVPEEWRTLVVVPVILHSPEGISEDLERLETRFLANHDANLHYALLADLPDAPQPEQPEDASLLAEATAGIERLNARYGQRFSLFTRPRRWSESEQMWLGWERKRGKLEELNRFLVGDPAHTLIHWGDRSQLEGVRFVITLDADTQLPLGAARRLVETLAHPLNRPHVAPGGQTVCRGYTIIQPRVSVSLPSATATRFARLFTNPVGTDPYTRAVSDVYQDLAGEGSYIGKGIYDLAAFHRVLGGRFPEALLLSHDLLEGAHVRAGLATDIELLDEFPPSYPAYAAREHRWIRGDWQIADWCTPWVPAPDGRRVPNPLSAINRWKIFDNLRRSLVPFGVLSVLVTGWWFAPVAAWLWTALAMAAVGLPPLVQTLDWILKEPVAVLAPRREWHRWRSQSVAWLRAAVLAALLPQLAALALDAIARAWYRRLVSHRRLLQWRTSQLANLTARERRRRVVWQSVIVSLLALAGIDALALTRPAVLPAATPFVTLWLLSPIVALWLNAELRQRDISLDRADRMLLRRLARHTWRYFDDLVGPATNWLPPDNYQEGQETAVATRTSPTNIGLWLLATLAARDFGYLTIEQVFERGRATLDTLERLERFQGHLLNWYDAATLAPLPPRYVSTVDSGNLLGSLWALVQGYQELLDAPVLSTTVLDGLTDTLALLREHLPAEHLSGTVREQLSALDRILASPAGAPEEPAGVIRRLRAVTVPARTIGAALAAGEAGQAAPGTAQGAPGLAEAAYWATQLERQAAAALTLVDRLVPWLEVLADLDDDVLGTLGPEASTWRDQAVRQVPSLRALAEPAQGPLAALLAAGAAARARGDLAPAGLVWLERLEQAAAAAPAPARELLAMAQEALRRAAALADAMDLRFLYDTERRLFAIGYHVDERRLDASFYDLLGSEARLASFIAIARGDVPAEHWLALRRPVGLVGGRRVLLSWGGTMFEYLMPLLLTRAYEHTLLDEACRAAVAAQITYGRQTGVPWGISEAAFSAVDAAGTYQYQAFGVPGLGLRRGLQDDLVVAPYATALALMLAPQEAVRNLKRLLALGLRGRYAFYEAIDYTPSRQGERTGGVIVRVYMAHHQGMSLLAMANSLLHGVMQARFHADPRVRAAEPLLFERIPVAPPLAEGVTAEAEPARAPRRARDEAIVRLTTPHTPAPRTHLLGNGTYAVMVTSAGGGYSRWRGIDVTRWRADTTLDGWGSFIYLRDLDSGGLWSAAYQPVGQPAESYEVRFALDRAEFQRRDAGIETHLEIAVAPDDDAELRRLTLVNQSSRTRHLEVTSYVELALVPHGADRAHPAFSKLFVRTERLADRRAVLAWRSPRTPQEPPVWALHVLSSADLGEDMDGFAFETDRACFLGRGRSARAPIALGGELTNTAGAVLDAVFSLRCRVTLDPGQRVQLAFVTGAAETRDGAIALAGKYLDPRAVARGFDLAWSRAQFEPRYLRVSAGDLQRCQQLASHLLYPNPRLRAAEQLLRQNRLGRERLWAYGISGDLPILLVLVGGLRDVDLVREVLVAHTYWHMRGFQADLVIVREEEAGYRQPLRDQLIRLIEAHAHYTGLDRPGGIFLRSAAAVSPDDLALLQTAAHVVLVASRGPLTQQLAAPLERPALPPPLLERAIPELAPGQLPPMELLFDNGLGGFTPDGREYVITLNAGQTTPAPWINVLANPSFGALVSESGAGSVWFGNSQTNRLLPWSNDPVIDPPGDAIYVRDEETGAYWTATPSPVRAGAPYRVRHGQGYTIFERAGQGIEQELVVFVPMDAQGGLPVRLQRLRLRNRSSRRRRLTATSFVEWVLGTTREETQLHVITSWVPDGRAILARNIFHPDYPGHAAFAGVNRPVRSFTADRTEFLGRNGSLAAPAALERVELSGRFGAGLDACAALQVVLELDPGEEMDVTFIVGEAADPVEARQLLRRFQDPAEVEAALRATRAWWNDLLDTVQVQTPDPGVNVLLNRWLLYQTLSCRIWARSALYQSGGAYGFRDQLQDVLALVHVAPRLAREHLLAAAARQFVEGDVQHWWHPQSGAGVRTRCSDDLLWLPFATAHYVRVTGDSAVLDEPVPFLQGRLLEPHEHEAYFVPATALDGGTLLEHCRRAVNRAAAALGEHGLPLMGSGDWNDGMNLVGAQGRGESVWLAWFLVHVLNDFADLLESRASLHSVQQPVDGAGAAYAAAYRRQAAQLASAVEQAAWDGEWYRRAYYDDGTPLGSRENDEARIDSLPQSWAAISGAGDPARVAQALQAAETHLVRLEERLVLLFTPPFERSAQEPGYVKAYPPGVRENGGQYTHAALWLAMAFARRGDGDRAVSLLRLLNPIEHACTPADVDRYRVEPYVVAADVYALEGQIGRGGWTWYTGSSGWMYRIWLEEILGVRRRGDSLCFSPALPRHWPECRLRYRWGSAIYDITLRHQGTGRAATQVELDGQRLPDPVVPLRDDGAHHQVVVTLDRGPGQPALDQSQSEISIAG